MHGFLDSPLFSIGKLYMSRVTHHGNGPTHVKSAVHTTHTISASLGPRLSKLGVGGGKESLVNIACACSVSPTHPQFSKFLEISVYKRLFSVNSLWIDKIAVSADHH